MEVFILFIWRTSSPEYTCHLIAYMEKSPCYLISYSVGNFISFILCIDIF